MPKTRTIKNSSAPSAPLVFDKHAIAAYRKIAANVEKIDEFYKAVDDVIETLRKTNSNRFNLITSSRGVQE